MIYTYTEADLARIDAAIASGGMVQTLTFGDQSVTFRTMAEWLDYRGFVARQVAAASGVPTTRYAATSKGV